MDRERAFWAWITRPEYYYDTDDSPRDILDPEMNPGGDGTWWTCHKDTAAGDLVMLYRSSPESDIAYVLEATSNARLLGQKDLPGVMSRSRFVALVREADVSHPDAYGRKARYGSFSDEWRALLSKEESLARHWERVSRSRSNQTLMDDFEEAEDELTVWILDFEERVFAVHDMDSGIVAGPPQFGAEAYVCDWRPRYVLKAPLTLAALKTDPWLAKNWNALRANFIQRAFRTDPDVWKHIVQLAERSGNRGITRALEKLGGQGPSADITSERDLEDRLAANPAQIPGHDLELVGDGYLGTGRQVSAGGGWIDLLGVDRATGNYVVVELKAVRAGRNVVGQVMSYVGWVAEHAASGSPVEAVVISEGVDAYFASASAAIPNLRQIDISALEA